MSKKFVLVDGVSKQYLRGDVAVKALAGVDLEVAKGSIVSIMGPSGSGKSTLLSLLGALDAPTSGSIKIAGEDLSKMGRAELTSYRRHGVGFVFQGFNLIPNLSALENVELPMEYAGVPSSERKKRSSELIASVGLEKRGSHRPAHMSGGEQQRVAIARALANDPPLILADEPTGNLDSKAGSGVMELLKRLAQEKNKTVVVVTHDRKIAGLTDRTLRIEDGRMLR